MLGPPEISNWRYIESATIDDVTVVAIANAEPPREWDRPTWSLERRLVDGGARRVLLDLRAVTFCSSVGIGELLRLHRVFQANGGRLAIYNIGANIWDAIRIMKLDRLIALASAEAFNLADALREWFPRSVAFDQAWRTDITVPLARGMYETGDFIALPILADALQDAGCDNPDILDHCRGNGPHVRGCWVVDLVLGKS